MKNFKEHPLDFLLKLVKNPSNNSVEMTETGLDIEELLAKKLEQLPAPRNKGDELCKPNL